MATELSEFHNSRFTLFNSIQLLVSHFILRLSQTPALGKPGQIDVEAAERWTGRREWVRATAP